MTMDHLELAEPFWDFTLEKLEEFQRFNFCFFGLC